MECVYVVSNFISMNPLCENTPNKSMGYNSLTIFKKYNYAYNFAQNKVEDKNTNIVVKNNTPPKLMETKHPDYTNKNVPLIEEVELGADSFYIDLWTNKYECIAIEEFPLN